MRRNLQNLNLTQLRDKPASWAVSAGFMSRLRRIIFSRMCFSMCRQHMCCQIGLELLPAVKVGWKLVLLSYWRNIMNVQYYFIHEIRDVLFAYRVSSRLAASQFGRINNIILSTVEDLRDIAATRNRSLYLAGFPDERKTLRNASHALSAMSAA